MKNERMNNQAEISGFQVDGRVFINAGQSSFVGQGKIELIEKISMLGSLRKAATSMNMSYRQAWAHINKINAMSRIPLVILKRGGKEGGLAQVTEYGEKVVRSYQELHKAFDEFLRQQTKLLRL
jgi:molybdate transport system regulatory protein